MKQQSNIESSASNVQSSSGIAGIVFALLLLLGALVNACQDQPIDSGITVIRDTIRSSRDSIIYRDSIVTKDSIIYIDSIIYRDSIILKDSIVIKEETVIRDSVRYIDSIRYETKYDTIKVPENVLLHRKAILHYKGYVDSLGLNSRVETANIDLTQWLQYEVVDSNSNLMGISISMSAAIPPQSGRLIVANMQQSLPFYLRGLAINIPLFRLGPLAGPFDTVPLNRHPYNWLPSQERTGGIMITAQLMQGINFLQGWTGQFIEVTLPVKGDHYTSWGSLKIVRIAPNDRIIFAQIQTSIYVITEQGGRQVVERFDLTLDLELGY